MGTQTSYPTKFGALPAGHIDLNIQSNVVDAKINNEGADLNFGRALFADTAFEDVRLADAVTDRFLGVSVLSHRVTKYDSNGLGVVESEQQVSVMRRGFIVLDYETGSTPVAGQKLFTRVTAAGAEVVGAFRADSDSGDAVAVPVYVEEVDTTNEKVWAFVDALSGDSNEPGDAITFGEDHAQNADGGTVKTYLYEVPADKVLVIDEVTYYNATGLAEDASNHADIRVEDAAASKVAANWSTETGQEGTIAADTPVTLTNGTLANRTFAGGTRLNITVDETGTTTVPAGSIRVHGRLI